MVYRLSPLYAKGRRQSVNFMQVLHHLTTVLTNAVKSHVTTTLLLLGLVVYVVMEYRAEQESVRVYQSLQRNDFLFVDYYQINPGSDPIYRYIPLKVLTVNDDNFVFKVGNIAHTTPVSPRKHVQFDAAMRRNFFRVDPLTFTTQQVEEFIEKGIVYAARRPKTMYIDGWIAIHKFDIVPPKE